MNDTQLQLITDAQHIVIIQAENPDGDSLGTALGLEEIFGDMSTRVSLFCAVDMPKYLRHLSGWDRVTSQYDLSADLVVMVDNASDTLVSKLYDTPGARHHLETHPVLVFDHHGSVESSLTFPHELIVDPAAVATGELIYRLAKQYNWPINQHAAECLMTAILADSLGLTTAGTTARSIHTVAELVEHGANPADLEARRRELMKKSPEILRYKGELLQRIDYHLEGKLAIVHITWDDIHAYSDQYNPSVLVLDEMRLVTGVEIAIAIKTYPDGKLTGKLRCNLPVADQVAGYFGGGGHPYAAGFRTFESYDTVLRELIECTTKILGSHDETVQHTDETT